MRIAITGLSELRQRLEAARPADTMAQALAEQSERLAETVRASLSEPAGSGEHDKPWARTGALRDSIVANADGLEAAVGSNDSAAVYQEQGTSRIPPRPFLAPAAAAQAEIIAQAVGDAVAARLKGS